MESSPQKTTVKYFPVKLAMEVSFTTHSHIIGRGGFNINTVMKDTSTKIHFPDENRVAGKKKSNEVTIAGELTNVEMARRRIRESVPVEYMLECRSDILDAHGRTTLIREFASIYGVLVRMNEKSSGPYCSVNIRGSQQDILRLKEAVRHMLELCNNRDGLVSMKLEVSTEDSSGLRAHSPDLENKFSTGFLVVSLLQHREDNEICVVWIRGTIDAVYQAKAALTDLLPLKLMFHVHAIHLNYGVNERKLAKRLDVAVKMEASSKPNSFLLHITSYERNAGNIYEFRRQILHLPNNSSTQPAWPPPHLHAQEPALQTQASPLVALAQPRFRETLQNVPSVVSLPPQPDLFRFAQWEHLSSAIDKEPAGFPRSSVCTDGPIPASLNALKFDLHSYRQLCQTLTDADLVDYCELFLNNEVDLAMFSTLNDQDLQSVGVSAPRVRSQMLRIIKELKSHCANHLQDGEPFFCSNVSTIVKEKPEGVLYVHF